MKLTIFYSWQSDTDANYNKNLILDCIKESIKNIENKGQLKGTFFVLEESTSNLPGSPNIKDVIETRIDHCDIFIGDLTITNSYKWILEELEKNRSLPYKFSPNSNVYGEYNRAFAKLGDSAVIAVMNIEHGDPKTNESIIPFDTRQNRFPFAYKCSSDAEIPSAKYQLKLFFENAIRESTLKAFEEQRLRYLPLITLAEHAREFEVKCQYCSNQELNALQEIIYNNKSNIRVVGLSGMGKTRLVFEAIKKTEGLRYRYLYCDCFDNDFNEIKNKVDLLFRERENPLVVLDNCSYEQTQLVLKLSKRHNIPKGSIITIWNQEDPGNLEDFDYLNLNINLHDIIEEIIVKKSNGVSEYNKKLISEFSDGFPLMAILLSESLKEDQSEIGKLSNNDFVNKLIFEDNEEREILKTCSLFRYIGFEEDLRSQVKFIVGNIDITPIDGTLDVKLAIFDRLFNKYKKRAVIETRGRLFGIRPRPLAFALAEEWFESCSYERMEKVIQLIQEESNPDRKILTESLCSQIIYLGNSEKVRLLIEKLTKEGGPFDNAKVLDTELGSRLFRSFVEVNPIAVGKVLFRIFGGLSATRIRDLKDGRRNLIWTFEKLCFDNRTFEKGAKLMMLFAIGENENIANNATGEFLRLFKILLPGTEADLNERLNIIKWGLTQGRDFHEVLMKAIESGLSNKNFNFFGGSEKQGTRTLEHYEPSWKEVREYWNSLIILLKEIIIQDPRGNEKKVALNILINAFRGLVRGHACDLILPVIGDFVNFEGGDWDEMLEIFYIVVNYDSRYLTQLQSEQISEYIALLTKQDFVSRFISLSKSIRIHRIRRETSFEEEISNLRDVYKEMADEFIEENFCSEAILIDLFKNTKLVIPADSFGRRIAESMAGQERLLDNQSFISTCIKVFKCLELPYNTSIFIDYAVGLEEGKALEFLIQQLSADEEVSYLLFSILAARHTSLDEVEILFQLISNGIASIDNFQKFFAVYPISNDNDGEITFFLKKLLCFGLEGYKTVIAIINQIFYFKNDKATFPELIEFAIDTVLYFFNHFEDDLLVGELYELIIKLLEQSDSGKIARIVNLEVIQLARNDSLNFLWNHNIETLYRILMEKYFSVIWKDLSDALLSVGETYMVYSNYRNLLGATIGSPLFGVGLLFLDSKNFDQIRQWCVDNPEVAPSRLASMVPFYSETDFHPLVKFLLDEFGNDNNMLSSLSSNMRSFSWSGSVIPIYQRQIDTLRTLLEHNNPNVVSWSQTEISFSEYLIQDAREREEEEGFLFN